MCMPGPGILVPGSCGRRPAAQPRCPRPCAAGRCLHSDNSGSCERPPRRRRSYGLRYTQNCGRFRNGPSELPSGQATTSSCLFGGPAKSFPREDPRRPFHGRIGPFPRFEGRASHSLPVFCPELCRMPSPRKTVHARSRLLQCPTVGPAALRPQRRTSLSPEGESLGEFGILFRSPPRGGQGGNTVALGPLKGVGVSRLLVDRGFGAIRGSDPFRTAPCSSLAHVLPLPGFSLDSVFSSVRIEPGGPRLSKPRCGCNTPLGVRSKRTIPAG